MTLLDESQLAQQLERVQDVVPVAILFCQPIFVGEEVIDFRYVWGNRMAHQLVRLNPEEFQRATMLELFPDFAHTGIFGRYRQVWQTGEPQRFERHHPIGSEEKWVDVSVSKKNDGLVITALDITASKQATLKLEHQTQLLQNIVESSPAALALLQPVYNAQHEIIDFRYVLTNPTNARTLGLTVEQLTNHTLLEFFPKVHQHESFDRLVNVFQTGQSMQYESHYQTDELNLWLQAQLNRVEEGVLLTYLDTTYLRQQEGALRAQAELVQQKNEALRQANEALERSNKRLQVLKAIQQDLLSSKLTDEPPELNVLPLIRELVPCERLVVFRFDEHTGQAQAESRLVDGRLEIKPGTRITSQYLKIEPLLSGQPLRVDSIQPASFNLPLELDPYALGYRSLLIVPMFSREQYLGVFMLFSNFSAFFTDDHLQIVQEVAGQLAIVLLQQQFKEKIQQHTDELEQHVVERTAEIRQLSALQDAILKHTDVAILALDIQGVVQSINPALERMLGYKADDLIGKKSPYFFDDSSNPVLPGGMVSTEPQRSHSTRFNVFAAILQRSGHFQIESTLMSAHGEPVPVLLTASAIRTEQGKHMGYIAMATNISELKQTETLLRRKTQKLLAFFESSLALHAIANREGYLTQLNSLWEQVLGYSLRELMDKPFIDFVHPDDRIETLQTFNRLRSQQMPIDFINRYRHKDGSYRVIEWRSKLLDQLVVSSARDITDQHRLHRLLQRTNQRLNLATQAARQGVWQYDFKQDKLTWDKRMFDIHGLPVDADWSFEKYINILAPEEKTAFLARQQTGDLTNFNEGVVRIIWSDGTIHFTEVYGVIVRDRRGLPLRAVGVASDVTDRVMAERDLRESEQRFRDIAENVDEVFWIYSIEPLKLLYVNPAYERVWCCSCQQLYDDPASLLHCILEEDRPTVTTFLERMLSSDESQKQYRLRNGQGHIRWVSIRAFLMRDSEGKPQRLIGIANDITSQKEKELVLEQALAREQELNKLKSQFVATASHEFRTPLTTIQSSVDLIGLYLQKPQGQPLIQKHLGIIQQQIQNFSGLLSDVLSLGKIETGKVAFRPDWVDMVALCQQILATHFSQQKDGRSVRLSIEGTPYQTHLDKQLIGHVLVNLLSNAFKFSQDDPKLRLVFEESQLTLQIIDQGIGIPAADLANLFQAFFRASNASTIQGTGLGLVIARQFVELHGGSLEVQSEPGRGTVFTIILPASTEPTSQPDA